MSTTDIINKTFLMDSPEPFWLVWSECGGAPTVKHKSHADAATEAHRLSLKHLGRKFYVLQSVDERSQVVVQTAIVVTNHKATASGVSP